MKETRLKMPLARVTNQSYHPNLVTNRCLNPPVIVPHLHLTISIITCTAVLHTVADIHHRTPYPSVRQHANILHH